MLNLLPVKRNQTEISPLDSLFDYLLEPLSIFNRPSRDSWMQRPRVITDETDKEYIVEAELAGFTKEEVKVEVTDERLTIVGAKKESDKSRSFSSEFHQTLYLPANIDHGTVKANLENGILKVILPKRVENVKQIEIT